MAATGGRGADVAVEASGSGAALQAAIERVAAEGTVVVASWYGTKPVALDLGGRFHRGRVRLRSSQVGRSEPGARAALGRVAGGRRRSSALLGRLGLDDLISHRFPFDRAPEAYQLLDERPGEAVQVVFTYANLREVSMYEVYVAARFEAAHRLVGDFGPATRMHGHTYRMEVIVRGQRSQKTARSTT